MNLILILMIPVAICLVNLVIFLKEVTLKEFFLQILAVVGVTALFFSVLSMTSLWDTQVINGKITSKVRHVVSCRHSYSCNCVTVYCGENCTTEVCDTCYDHNFDVDWDVYTDIGRSFSIYTIDRQGLKEPPRWTLIQPGDPYATTSSYANYIKANSSTLFIKRGLVGKYKDLLPKYPINIYDYYHLDRLVQVGTTLDHASGWNRALEWVNSDLGPSKQCNVILVVVKEIPQDYFYALQEHWLGGKKNDIIVVVSQGADRKIRWVQTMAWSVSSLVKIRINDDLMALGSLEDSVTVLAAIQKSIRGFYIRKSFKEFEYLANTIPMTSWKYIFLFLLSVGTALGVSYVINNNQERENNRPV